MLFLLSFIRFARTPHRQNQFSGENIKGNPQLLFFFFASFRWLRNIRKI